MRFMTVAILIVLGSCLAYSHFLNPAPPDESYSYDGPATFLNLNCYGSDDAPKRWLLVCQVNGSRIVFVADDDWVRRASGLHAGQLVHLHYDLPAKPTASGGELAPPTLRYIAAQEETTPSFALNHPQH